MLAEMLDCALSVLCAARNKRARINKRSCIHNSTYANKYTCMHIHTIEATAN